MLKVAEKTRKMRLGELLISKKLITENQFKEALKRSLLRGSKLGASLVIMGFVEENVLLDVLSSQLKIKGVNLNEKLLRTDTLNVLSFEMVKTCQVIPVDYNEGKKLLLGMADPYNYEMIKDLEYSLGINIEPVIVPSSQIEKAIEIWSKEGYAVCDFDGNRLKQITTSKSEAADVFSLLRTVRDTKASDLHLSVGVPPSVRLDNNMERLDLQPLTKEKIEAYIGELISEESRAFYNQHKTIDFSFALPDVGRFRINIYKQRGTPCITARFLTDEIPSFEELSLPNFLKRFAVLSQGLVLLTGPTGHGKSTTLAAMIDMINYCRKANIITIEDPIEYLHKHINSNVNQREVGVDTNSFSDGLRDIFRQDPDVIMIGEIRDLESCRIAMRAAETGHLVFGTLHTRDTVGAVDRIIDMFPGEEQDQVRFQISEVLQLVFAQRLVNRADGQGRTLAWEKLEFTYRIRNQVRSGKAHMIRTMMNPRDYVPLEVCLAALVQSEVVKKDVALYHAPNAAVFEEWLSGGSNPMEIIEETSKNDLAPAEEDDLSPEMNGSKPAKAAGGRSR